MQTQKVPKVPPFEGSSFTVLSSCENDNLMDGVSAVLTHWGRLMHICIADLTIIDSDNGLLPGRRQAIIWTNAGMLSIGPLGTNFSAILIRILTFSFKKMCVKVLSEKWWSFSLGLNVLSLAINVYFSKQFSKLKVNLL